MMQNVVKTIFGLLLFALFCNAQTPHPTKIAPSIHVDQPNFDFGEVPSDTLITHVFEVKNEGTDTLRIIRLKSG